jgi:hypothetical protein
VVARPRKQLSPLNQFIWSLLLHVSLFHGPPIDAYRHFRHFSH